MQRLTISQYLQRPDAYPVTPATVRNYIENGILPGEKIKLGKKTTYYVHIHTETPDNLLKSMIQG